LQKGGEWDSKMNMCMEKDARPEADAPEIEKALPFLDLAR